MSFHSFFWVGVDLGDGPEGLALEKLMQPETGNSGHVRALEALLQSASTPAQCIALDHISYAESLKRWGQQNQYGALDELVKKRIVEQLDAPPFVRNETGADPRVGANHASALHASAVLGYPDAERTHKALKLNSERNVVWEGVRAAEAALYDEPGPFLPLVELLKVYADDQTLPVELQAAAVHAIGSVAGDEFDSYLLEMARCSRRKVAAAAARCLSEKDFGKYRKFLESVVSTWPDDYISYDAAEVRAHLESNNE